MEIYSQKRHNSYDSALRFIIQFVEDRTSTTIADLAGKIDDTNSNLVKRINRLAKKGFEELSLPDCFNYYEMAKFMGDDQQISMFYHMREDVLFFFRNPRIIFDSSEDSVMFAIATMDIDFYTSQEET